MARNGVHPLFIVNADLPTNIDSREIQLIICEAANNAIKNNVSGAQLRDGVWFLWVKSNESRQHLISDPNKTSK